MCFLIFKRWCPLKRGKIIFMHNILDIISVNKNLHHLVDQAIKCKHLNQLWKSLLEPNLAKHCDLGKLEKDLLTVIAHNASWATKLRYAAPDILKTLHTQPEFAKVKKLKFLVATAVNKIPSAVTHQRSTKNADLWRETMQALKKSAQEKTVQT